MSLLGIADTYQPAGGTHPYTCRMSGEGSWWPLAEQLALVHTARHQFKSKSSEPSNAWTSMKVPPSTCW